MAHSNNNSIELHTHDIKLASLTVYSLGTLGCINDYHASLLLDL